MDKFIPCLSSDPEDSIVSVPFKPGVLCVLRFMQILFSVIIIGTVGFYFSYYQGSYRYTLFHSECFMLVAAVVAFLNTIVNILSSVTAQMFASSTVSRLHSHIVSSSVSCVLQLLSGIVFLIQVSVAGRYLVDQYEAKLFCGSLALINFLIYGGEVVIVVKDIQAEMGN
ncbi:uncharacterized protein LOC111702086 [Eurytemora carolleeae]|uniref:uncharacterized protein LOC111702086 n=1 Tax=Eurytemora carolleeae TaxID=1294199 RepID=UPI000C762C24|nr:uncharacterized protein LOC111702086 [Eurytemora carolleeae]|eukprot:XP_023329423.1 uncharacterized protein LOC111702086 [Eurytemora affinis]